MMEAHPIRPLSDRHLRVFISSTFRDMHAERNHLVTVIFPQLRRLCEARGVTWGEVDLRWGVTDEAVAEGRVLPICLEEIERCRPYFIGLLGERYGSVPQYVPDELLEREAWLREPFQERKSVTELEILHGVLRNPAMANHAYFYFRDPAYASSLPEPERGDFLSESAEAAMKLKQLKELIGQSRLPVRANYPDPKALGELVLADLTAVINQRWPEGSEPNPLQREALDHAAYARSRERVYIGRPEYFARLDAHAVGRGDQPLVILGESGSGKSALLANWVARYRQAHPETFVLEHYIGATPASADWAAMLRRILREFKQQLGLTQDIPDHPDALRSAFPNWLHMAAATAQSAKYGAESPDPHSAGAASSPAPPSEIVIVLDALSQLEDRDGAPDLLWLPPAMPENVRLIVSTLPGRALDEIAKRRWPVFKVEPLTVDERKELIRQFLRGYGRELSSARAERIAGAPQSANPLYLRVLLDELRIFGQRQRLEERIGFYLEAGSPYELYVKVIARWESAFGAEMTRDTLTLLWAARRGLSESELLDILGRDGQPLPRAVWSPLFLAMDDAVVSRRGLLTFAHDFLRTAVRDVYLPAESGRQQAHLRLANYFGKGRIQKVRTQDGLEIEIASADHLSGEGAGRRRTDELPWQLAAAQAWEPLCALLSDGHAFNAIWEANEFDAKNYWARLEEHGFRIADSYRLALELPEIHSPEILANLSQLLFDMGQLPEALALTDRIVELYRKNGDEESLAAALLFQADLRRARGDLDGCLTIYEQVRQVFAVKGSARGRAAALANAALAHKDKGQLDRALDLQREAGALWQELGDRTGVMHALGNQAVIHNLRSEYEEALALLERQERLCKEAGDLDGLEACVGNQAMARMDQGEPGLAKLLLERQEGICRQMGRKMSLATCLGNQAVVLIQEGQHELAMPLLEEQERICQEVGDKAGLSRAWCNQGIVFRDTGQLNRAMELHRRSAQMDRETGNRISLAVAIHNQADDYYEMGDLDMAIRLFKESEKLSRELGSRKGIAESMARQAELLWELPEWRTEAMRLMDDALDLARQSRMQSLVQLLCRGRAKMAQASEAAGSS